MKPTKPLFMTIASIPAIAIAVHCLWTSPSENTTNTTTLSPYSHTLNNQDSVIIDYAILGGDFSTHHYQVTWWYEVDPLDPLTPTEITKINRQILNILKEEAEHLNHNPIKEDINDGIRWARLTAMQITDPIMLDEIHIVYINMR